jgi:thymidylate kinase
MQFEERHLTSWTMLIEFFGLPGAGKSTMSRLAADLLLQRGIVVDEITYTLDHRRPGVERQLTKLGQLLRYAAAHPGRALSDSVRITVTRQATLLDLGKSIFNWTFIAAIAWQNRSSTNIAFLDQGIAQAMWSVGFAARHENWLDRLRAVTRGMALRPDLVIHVRANLQTIGERLASRRRRVSRLDALHGDYKALQRAETQSDTIMRRLRASGVPVVEVENNDPAQLRSGAQLVAGVIMTMLNEQRITLEALPLVRHEAPRPDCSPSR